MVPFVWLFGLLVFGAVPAADSAPMTRCTVAAAFGGDCEKLLLQHLDTAENNVRIAIYTFTRDTIADKLVELLGRGVDVRLKVDAEQAKIEGMGRHVNRLRRHGAKIDAITNPKAFYPVHMHHKFVVVDRRTVLTGSYNWTSNASENNWENLVVIDSALIASEFLREWDGIRDRK